MPLHDNEEVDSIQALNAEIAGCVSLEQTCLRYAEILDRAGLALLSVKFCDLEDKMPTLRPYGGYPVAIKRLSNELRDSGGCPITREALKTLRPFDAMALKRADYPDFMSARFIDELGNIGHRHIAVVPLLLGKGLMLTTVGLGEAAFRGKLREDLTMSICNFGVAVAQKVGDVGRLFRSKHLTRHESNALFLYCSGFTKKQISEITGLGSMTLEIIMKSACGKLEARNIAEATARALAKGEISNIHNL